MMASNAVIFRVGLGLLAGAWAGLAAAQPIRTAPLNPDFVRYRAQCALGHARPAAAAATRRLGHVPAPVNLSRLQGRGPAPASTAKAAFPRAYDLRTLGRVSAVRNQDPHGTCWAHAALASLESCLLPGASNQFSVNHMVNLAGFDNGYDDGGGGTMATAYLARWNGPVLEADDPYPNPGHSPRLPPVAHVQQVDILPLRSGPLDNDALKRAVMTYGAVDTGMYWDDAAYRTAHAAYYYAGGESANHSVAIVGWDDDFPADRFAASPPGPGAFIVKNSWGPEFGDGGYYYQSYYDHVLGFDENLAFYSADPVTNYDGLYQYDPLGLVGLWGFDAPTAWAAAVFAATSSAPLCAAGVYAPQPGTRYDLQIHTGVTPGQPRSGLAHGVQTGTLAHAGFCTIPLDAPVALAAGDRFAVVIRLAAPSLRTPVAVEYAQSNYSSRAAAAPGETFLSADGIAWSDATLREATASVCLKAYVGAGAPPGPVSAVVPVDYDGDGRADPAVYVEPGAWRLRLSASGYALLALPAFLGAGGDCAAPADYDGDGRADPAVYAPATGDWTIRLSGAGYAPVALPAFFGGAGWSPASADYDGDGRADPALYRDDAGDWQVKLSTAGYAVFTADGLAGGPGWMPAAADYDGDGRADPAVYAPATGDWTIRLSGAGYAPVVLPAFLGGGRHPASADYDGDGRADPAVVDDVGTWTIRLSTAGYQTLTLRRFLGG